MYMIPLRLKSCSEMPGYVATPTLKIALLSSIEVLKYN